MCDKIVQTTEVGWVKKRLLFDSGPDPRAIERNIAALKIPVEEIDRVVLSHWHRDHSGGILKFLELRQRTQAPNEVVVDLHPDRPTVRGTAPPPYKRVVNRLPEDPTFEGVQVAGGRVEKHAEGHVVQDGTVFVSGEILRGVPHEQGLLGGSRWIEGEELDDPRWKERESLIGAENPHVKGRWVAEPVWKFISKNICGTVHPPGNHGRKVCGCRRPRKRARAI
jgi:7,8-dihydropterin-6-yl-methyl-4-(beta-D-ribofuranosyl)aminobenzene 5'-phosphate synthase